MGMRMRTLSVALGALALAAPSAAAASGGATVPPSAGGTEYGTPLGQPRASNSDRAPFARFFRATRRAPVGTALRFAFRIDGGGREVRVRVDVLRRGERKPVRRLNLGMQPTRRKILHRWARAGGPLPAGEYVARLHAVDLQGRNLARRASAADRDTMTIVTPPPPPAPVTPLAPVGPGVGAGIVPGRFPILGPHGFGGADARFGAGRPGHIHQGQDVTAAEGTPLVSPVAGTVYWRAYQAGGAGHYLVIRGTDQRDYVFMHLQSGSPVVDKDATVASGQRIASVGTTGSSSGPHLHFEIWVGGWQARGGRPIDPLPQLRAWDS